MRTICINGITIDRRNIATLSALLILYIRIMQTCIRTTKVQQLIFSGTYPVNNTCLWSGFFFGILEKNLRIQSTSEKPSDFQLSKDSLYARQLPLCKSTHTKRARCVYAMPKAYSMEVGGEKNQNHDVQRWSAVFKAHIEASYLQFWFRWPSFHSFLFASSSTPCLNHEVLRGKISAVQFHIGINM